MKYNIRYIMQYSSEIKSQEVSISTEGISFHPIQSILSDPLGRDISPSSDVVSNRSVLRQDLGQIVIPLLPSMDWSSSISGCVDESLMGYDDSEYSQYCIASGLSFIHQSFSSDAASSMISLLDSPLIDGLSENDLGISTSSFKPLISIICSVSEEASI